MQQEQIAYRRLPLQGAPNTRDLGGYPCPAGITRWRQFVRSSSTHSLTASDIAFLEEYGITTVIDLRGPRECESHPSALAAHGNFALHNIPLLGQMDASGFEGDVPGSMAGLYIELLDNRQAALLSVFKTILAASGGILFHCTAGKDRTGIVAMLLLKLAGVRDDDIVADYSITDIHMGAVFMGPNPDFKEDEIPSFVFHSKPRSMWRTLSHLSSQYGSAKNFLLQAGLTSDEIKLLEQKIVYPIFAKQ